MKPTFLYSHQKPISANSPIYNKENLSLYPKRPPPIQTAGGPPVFFTPYNPPTMKSRSPFTTKANGYENQTVSIKRYESEEISSIDKKEHSERTEKNDFYMNKESIHQLDKALGKVNGVKELYDENIKLKKFIVEKVAEAEEWKRKLCDERVERKIANKKLETFEVKIKELLAENEKLNQSLNSRLEQGFPMKTPKQGTNNNDIRETLTSKEMENRVKALSQENERLFKENEELMNEMREVKFIENNSAESNREKEELKNNMKTLEGQIEQYKNQMEQYKAKSKDLESELLQSHVCISDLEKKLKTLMNNQESLNNSVISVSRRGGEEEIKTLKAILGRYKQEGGKIQEILDNRRKELEIVKKELERVRRENRKLLKMRLEWEENMEKERKEKDEYKELIENQSVILRERELELDEKLIEIDEIRKGFLDLSSQQQGN